VTEVLSLGGTEVLSFGRTEVPSFGRTEVLSFGCRLNAYEAEVIREQVDDPDLIVVNTCAVTNEAVRQARQAIRRAARTRPDARIVVTGCAAQIDPAGFAAMPEVAQVLGNIEKLTPGSYAPGGPPVRVADIMTVRETAAHLLDGYAVHTRAFVEIQTGCDHRCTFCVIPFGRGNSRSVPAAEIVERIRRLVGNGIVEVVLTGVDITSYGPEPLGILVQRILRDIPDLPRLRLSSIDSVEVDPALFDAVAGETRLMPQLHLSLQAGDDMILKRMKRRHLRAQAIDFCTAIRRARPDIALGADFITGFPTETEAMFDQTMALVDDCGLSQLHVFPFSARAGTPAALMPQVAPTVARDRAARLRTLGQLRRTTALAATIGRPQRVLVEGDGASGHTEAYLPTRLRTPAPRGTIVTVTPQGLIDGVLDCL